MSSDDVIIPRKEWDSFLTIFENMVVASSTAPPPAPAPSPPSIDQEHEIFVDQANGDDQNDGQAGSPVRTFARMARLIKPRTIVTVAPGYYRERMDLINLEDRLRGQPVWIKAETPGSVTLTATHGMAAAGVAEWTNAGGDVWRTVSAGGAPWAGHADGKFLFLYDSVDDLRSNRAAGANKPAYGLAWQGGYTYVRMPDQKSPAGRHVIMTGAPKANMILLQNSPNVIIDGFRLAGSGNAPSISADRQSTGLTVRNCMAELCRMMARISSGSVMEWNVYTYPGFMAFAEDVADMNDGRIKALFDLIKRYRSSAIYEGRLAIGVEGAAQCLFERNLLKHIFDGQTLGEFRSSTSIGNMSIGAFDDTSEYEGWAPHMTSADLLSVGDWSIDAFGSHVSIQPKHKNFTGPLMLTRGVAMQRHRLATPAYVMKIMGDFPKKPDVIVDRWFFHVARGPNSWGKTWLYQDDERARDVNLTIKNSIIYAPDGIDESGQYMPRCDGNVVVADKPYPHIQGPNGSFVADIGALKMKNFPKGIDIRPTEESPLIGGGLEGTTVGPFDPGDELLPRPMDYSWTGGPPAKWTS